MKGEQITQRVRSVVMLLGIFWLTAVLTHAAPPSWQEKVDPALWAAMAPAQTGAGDPTVEILVQLAEQPDYRQAAGLPSKEARGAFVYAAGTAVAVRTQPALLDRLTALDAPYRPFWIVNVVQTAGDATLVRELALREDVAYLYANASSSLSLPPPQPDSAVPASTTAQNGVPGNLTLLKVPEVWSLGITGAGVVIGGQDTGYEWEHPALKGQYRGWDAASGTVDHDRNWHDTISSGSSFYCDYPSPEPCDDWGSSHGTHTMGTMVGNDLAAGQPNWPAGAVHAIGVAPGAEWIGCRNMEVGVGTAARYIECYEWFVAPYPMGGDPVIDGDPDLAPHIINNSWGCPPSETGCTVPGVMEEVVSAVRAAGILSVHAAGNEGSGCGSVKYPAATYDASFSVAATTLYDTIASFSSRGPSTFDGGLKPDISAPGVGILSAVRGDAYNTSQGTSMAAPHVAGLAALLIEADPTLAGDVDRIEAIIRQTAVPLTTHEGCGGDTTTAVPNHTFGYGRIDALTAVTTARLAGYPYKHFIPFVSGGGD